MTTCGWNWYCKLSIASLLGIGGAFASSRCAQAQVAPDNTLGTQNSVVTPNLVIRGLPSDRIDGGAIRGGNLFHSFQEFNVGAGRGVYFTNPAGIDNILSRVTGNNPSNILGRLGILGNANLFLLNPNGIIFGTNASLDIKGSFLATTANAIQLGSQGKFSASEPGNSNLLSVSPGTLFFNAVANQSGTISNAGNLAVGGNLTLSGGSVASTGQLTAPAGDVAVTGVSGDVEVRQLSAKTATLSAFGNLTLIESQLQTDRDLNLLARDTVRVRDSAANPFNARAGGNLNVQGDRGIDILALNHPGNAFASGDNLSLVSDGIISGDAHFASGGNFAILNLSGGGGEFLSLFDPIIRSNRNVSFGNYTGTSLKVEATGNITTGRITINNADATATGDPDSALLTGGRALILRAGVSSLSGTVVQPSPVGGTTVTFTNPPSAAGTLSVNGAIASSPNTAPLRVILEAKGNITTQNITSAGGDITLKSTAGGINTTAGSVNSSSRSGNGGAISLNAPNDITTGNLSSYSNRSGTTGGSITLNSTTGSINTTAGTVDSDSISGNGGAIAFSAKNNITTRTLYSYANGGGVGGNITLNSTTGSINTTAGIVDSDSISGNGGAIAFSANNNITTGTLYSYANGGGVGGNITLNSTIGEINTTGGSVDSSSNSGNGGAIALNAKNNITTGTLYSYANGAGAGGSITLNSTTGEINTTKGDVDSSSDSGNGGAIAMNANNSITTGNLSSYSNDGNGGSITLNSTTGGINTTVGSIDSSSISGNGGAIALNASGKIVTANVDASSVYEGSGGISLFSSSSAIDTTAGSLKATRGSGDFIGYANNGDPIYNASGGNVTLKAYSDITTGNIDAHAINLTSQTGSITVNNLKTATACTPADDESCGSFGVYSGAVNLSAAGNIKATTINTTADWGYGGGSYGGDGGVVNLQAGGDITVSGGQVEIYRDKRGSISTFSVWRDAGAVILNAGGKINVDGISTGSASRSGNDITLTSNDVINIGDIFSATYYGGRAGNVNFTATGDITTGAIAAYSVVKNPDFDTASGNVNLKTTGGSIATGGVNTASNDGRGGNITLDANKNIAPGSLLSRSTDGGSGDINLISNATISLGNSIITTDTAGKGKAGDINIAAKSIFLTDGGQISASTSSTGQGGNLTVSATASLVLSGFTPNGQPPQGVFVNIPGLEGKRLGGFIPPSNFAQQFSQVQYPSGLFTQTSGAGNAGKLQVTAGQLNIEKGAAIAATTFARGDAGSVSIKANNISVANGSILSGVTETATGKSGDIQIRGGSLSLTEGGIVQTLTLGQGKAGNIDVNVANSVTISGTSQSRSSGLLAGTERTDSGQGGNISVTTGALRLADSGVVSTRTFGKSDGGNITVNANTLNATSGGQLQATTSSSGRAGNITVNATDTTLDGTGSAIATSADINSTGRGGDLNITGRSLSLTNGAELNSSTGGKGEAGNIQVGVIDSVAIAGGSISTSTTSTGKGGNINVSTSAFQVSDGANLDAKTSDAGDGGNITVNANTFKTTSGGQLQTTTSGNGRAGNITVNAAAVATIEDGSGLSAQSVGNGNAGDLQIITRQLTVRDGKVSASTSGSGMGGSLIVKATDSVQLSGDRGLFTETSGSGNAGNLSIETKNLNLQNNAFASASTSGTGKGGSLTVNATDSIQLSDRSGLLAQSTGAGAAGDLQISTRQLIVGDTAKASASTAGNERGGNLSVNATDSVQLNGGGLFTETQGKGNAGNLAIATRSLTVQNGAKASASTSSDGQGGNLTVNAKDEVQLSGSGGLFTQSTGAGKAGELQINTARLAISNGATASTSTQKTGQGANLTVNASESVKLSNSGSLLTETLGMGDAGNLAIATGNLTVLDNAKASASTTGDGKGGNLTVNARDSVQLSGGGGLFTQSTGAGKAGELQITTAQLNVQNGSTVSASTSGKGTAGNISVQAKDSVSITDAKSGLFTNTNSSGKGGDITVDSNAVSLSNGAVLNAEASNTGDGGQIRVNANTLKVANARLSSSTSGSGNAGNISVQANDVNLTDLAQLRSSTDGRGNAGNIQVNKATSFNVSGNSGLFTNTNSSGKGGDITVDSNSVNVANGAVLNAEASNTGDGGQIKVNANNLEVANARLSSSTSGKGNAGNISVQVNDAVKLSDGAQLRSSTSGQGNAGNIQISKPNSVSIAGTNSGLFTNTDSTGKGGDISVDSNSVNVANGAVLNAEASNTGDGGQIKVNANNLEVVNARLSSSTSGKGNAGNISVQANDAVSLTNGNISSDVKQGAFGNGGSININTRLLSLKQGSGLSSSTSGEGNAGNIAIAKADTVNVDGLGSGLFTSTSTASKGSGGNLNLDTTNLNLTNGAVFSAQSQGTGKAGNITINARQAFNANNGSITATSNQAGGGSVTINAESVILRNSSPITTSVFDAKGDGGNIIINASKLFFAFDDSDILANARFGNGGNITINSPVFLADLFADGKATAVGRNPGDFARFRGNNRVDISASSQVGISGSINIPDFTFLQSSLSQLASNFVNADRIVSGSCLARRNAERGSFTVTGTGGLASTPYDRLSSRYNIAQIQSLEGGMGRGGEGVSERTWKLGDRIQEAQGISLTPNGRIIVGTDSQLVAIANAKEMICHPNQQQ